MKSTNIIIIVMMIVIAGSFTGCDWVVKQYTITASADMYGEIDPDGEVLVTIGENQRFRITPDEGFSILDVIVDGFSEGPVSSYTFYDVKEDHEIYATFSNTDNINVEGFWSGPMVVDGDAEEYTLEADLTQYGSDIGGNASISMNGVPVTTYTVNWTIEGTYIEGTLYGADESTYDIEVTATVNIQGDEIDGDFIIQESGASGTFTLTKE